jgi:hypothetical protein
MVAYQFRSLITQRKNMVKQLVAFVLAAGVSMSASAGYIQYTLDNVKLDDGSSLQGWFVQDTSDQSIAYYDFQSGPPAADHMVPWGSIYYNKMLFAESHFAGGAGPTSFGFQDTMSTSYYHVINLMFDPAPGGAIRVSGSDDDTPAPETYGWPGFQSMMRNIVGGAVVQSAVTEEVLLASLERGDTYLDRVVPNVPPMPVPEPGSLALLALGACAVARAGRRRAGR